MTPDIPESTFTRGRVKGGRYVPPTTTPRGGMSLGDVQIDETFVYTPIGRMRRDRTKWYIGETVPGRERIPTWATLCAVFLFLCMGPFSLLFLLAKERAGETTTVQLTDGHLTYTMKIDTYDREGYLNIVSTAEWSERALPGRAIEG